MSKKFYAINRDTGERWKSKKEDEYLVMYDTGMLAVVDSSYGYTSIIKLNTNIWKMIVKENMKGLINE